MKIICLLTIVVYSTNALTISDSTAAPSSHYTRLSSDEIHHLQLKGFGPTPAPARRTSFAQLDDSTGSASNARPYSLDSAPNYPSSFIAKPARHPPPQTIKIPQKFRVEKPEVDEDQEPEVEEPDRLSQLLPQSKFECTNRHTGYYADEELGCEVFHYCQDNARHSWICPDGFTFHQVHLICMPPGDNNICSRSSQYHFINDYLYKPVNLEEHQQQPNTSLRYSQRFYPKTYQENGERDQLENAPELTRPYKQHSTKVIPKHNLLGLDVKPIYNPDLIGLNLGQVYRSPNEVNIPLQQRRPQQFVPRYNVN